jgi:hypothetical protein
MNTALKNMREARKNRDEAGSEMRNSSPDKSETPQERMPNESRAETTGPAPTNETPDDDYSTPRDEKNSERNSDSSETTTAQTSGKGEFDLLVSDRPADISSFDYLNVTFDRARIFAGTEENETSINETEEDQEMNGTENATEEEEMNETESEGFREIEINDSTVDLTRVVGENAQSIANTELDAGTYNKIELYSSTINASVNGSNVDVKIPPGKLMITKPFTISENSTTEFVFDIQVVLRGNQQNNQGYILKPVISESGVAGKDVEMERGPSDSSSDEENSGSQAGGPPENPGNQGRP